MATIDPVQCNAFTLSVVEKTICRHQYLSDGLKRLLVAIQVAARKTDITGPCHRALVQLISFRILLIEFNRLKLFVESCSE